MKEELKGEEPEVSRQKYTKAAGSRDVFHEGVLTNDWAKIDMDEMCAEWYPTHGMFKDYVVYLAEIQ